MRLINRMSRIPGPIADGSLTLSLSPGRTGSFEVVVDKSQTLHSKLSGMGHVNDSRPQDHGGIGHAMGHSRVVFVARSVDDLSSFSSDTTVVENERHIYNNQLHRESQ